jgi:hypothetical protein
LDSRGTGVKIFFRPAFNLTAAELVSKTFRPTLNWSQNLSPRLELDSRGIGVKIFFRPALNWTAAKLVSKSSSVPP